MRKDIFGFLTAFMILASGCSPKNTYNPPKFKELAKADFQLLTDEQYWGGTSKIFKYGDILAVICYCRDAEPTWLHLFSCTGEHLGDMLHKGRGPMEVLAPTAVYLRGADLHIFDIMQHKMIEVDLSKVLMDRYSAYRSKKRLMTISIRMWKGWHGETPFT